MPYVNYLVILYNQNDQVKTTFGRLDRRDSGFFSDAHALPKLLDLFDCLIFEST
jgi:hypothetical protein